MKGSLKCPRCGKPLDIKQYTNFDNLETYYYPLCRNCNFTTKEVYYDKKYLATLIKDGLLI